MKHYIIILCLLIFTYKIFAQTVIYSENFNNSTDFPDGFIVLDNDGVSSTLDFMKNNGNDAWVIGQIPHEPNNNFVITSSKDEVLDTADNWLITPKIKLTNNNFLQFRVRNSSNQETSWESYDVLISESGTSELNDFEIIYSSTPGYQFEFPNIDLADYQGKEIRVAFRNNGIEGWMLFLDDISIIEIKQYDIELIGANLPNYIRTGEVSFDFDVKNWTNTVINNFDLICKVKSNGATIKEYEQKYSNFMLNEFETRSFKAENIFLLENPGKYEIEISVLLPNGMEDSFANNNIMKFDLSTIELNTDATKNILFEKVTGTWCGWCSLGAVITDELKKDYNIIPVAIHGGNPSEPMRTNEGNEFIQSFAPFFPAGAVDRVKLPQYDGVMQDMNEWENMIQQHNTNSLTMVSVELEISYLPNQRNIEIDVIADFLNDMEGEFRFNVYILEDNITGGTQYNQRNYLNNDPQYPELYQKGSSIEGFVHNHVLRDMLGGFRGISSEMSGIPNSVKKDELYTYSFEYEIPEEFKPEDITVVGYISLYDEENDAFEILNANKLKIVDEVSSVNEVTYDQNIKIFPNPANSNITITGLENVEKVVIYDLNGNLIQEIDFNNNSANNISINISELLAGTYVAHLHSNEQIKISKFVVGK